MFHFFTKKSQKFAKAWEEKNPAELGAKEKSLYALAEKIQRSRIAGPGSVSISEDAQNRIKENLYHKYFNIIGSRQPARKIIREQKISIKLQQRIPVEQHR